MSSKFSVRYGRNYKVVLAMVLPCVLIVPFIYVLREIPNLEEWQVLAIIFAFLGLLMFSVVWLVKRIYPATIMILDEREFRLIFDQENFFSPADFNVQFTDIVSFTRREIKHDEYFVIETRNPKRKFQISASTYSVEDLLSFNEAMVLIGDKIQEME